MKSQSRVRIALFGALFALAISQWVSAADGASAAEDEIGRRIATAFNERSSDTLIALLDMKKLGRRVAVSMFENATAREGFANGFARPPSAQRLVSQYMAQLDRAENSSAKFMRSMVRGQERRPLVRLDYGATGFEYLEYVLERDDEGVSRIVDWYSLSSGELFSTTVSTTSRLIMDPEPGLLTSMFGLQKIDRDAIDKMKRIAELRLEGRLQEAYDGMAKLPRALAESRQILVQRATLAGELGDESSYKRMLGRLEQLYGNDPAAAFSLIDHFYFEKNLPKFNKAIDTMERQVGADGLTHLLRANMLSELGQAAQAIKITRTAIEVEPDFEQAHLVLAQLLVNAGQFDDAVKAFQTLETDFDYVFSKEGFEADESFAKFVESKAFGEWMKGPE